MARIGGKMDINFRVFSFMVVVCYFVVLAGLLKKGTFMVRYSLLWLAAGVVIAVFALFPKLLERFSKLLGVETPSNALFILCIMFVVFILMALTAIVSFQKKRLRQLSQKIALIEHDLEIVKRERNTENAKA